MKLIDNVNLVHDHDALIMLMSIYVEELNNYLFINGLEIKNKKMLQYTIFPDANIILVSDLIVTILGRPPNDRTVLRFLEIAKDQKVWLQASLSFFQNNNTLPIDLKNSKAKRSIIDFIDHQCNCSATSKLITNALIKDLAKMYCT